MEQEARPLSDNLAPKRRKFHARSRFLLRLGARLVVTVRLFLSAPSELTDLMFKEMMEQMKVYLSEEVMANPQDGRLMVVTRYTPSAPRHYVKQSFHFMYYWVPRDVDFSLLTAQFASQTAPEKTRSASEMDSDSDFINTSNRVVASGSANTEVLTPKKPSSSIPGNSTTSISSSATAIEGTQAVQTTSTRLVFQEMDLCEQMIVIVVLKPGKKSVNGDEIDLGQGAVVENQISRYFGAYQSLLPGLV